MLFSTLGFLVLAAMTGTLLTHALAQATRLALFWSLLMIVVLTAFIYQCRNEWTRIFHTAHPAASNRETPALTVLAIVAGAMTTFILANAVDLGPVVAAGIVGAIGALITRSKAAAVYGGAFVGMVSQDCLYASTHVVFAALLAAAVFLLAVPVFNGFGGKLGAIAFTGCVAMAWLTGNPLAQAPIPDASVNALIVLFSVAASLGTFSLSIRLKLGPVMASALVGLAGGLLLPPLMPETGPLLAIVVFCASFTGMSSRERLADERRVALAGLITGLIFIFTLPAMGGAGGKLGAIAFASSLAAKSLADWATRRSKDE